MIARNVLPVIAAMAAFVATPAEAQDRAPATPAPASAPLSPLVNFRLQSRPLLPMGPILPAASRTQGNHRAQPSPSDSSSDRMNLVAPPRPDPTSMQYESRPRSGANARITITGGRSTLTILGIRAPQ